MIKQFSRKQVVIAVSILVVLVLGGYGLYTQWPRLTNPYFGLTTHIDVQMDDSTRTLIQQRIATAEASLAAQEKSGGEVDAKLYLTIAENQKMLGDLVASRKMYEKSISLNDKAYVVWNSYAKLLEFMNDLPNAEAAYKKALDLLKIEGNYRDYAEFLQAHYPERRTERKALLDEAFTTAGQTPWTMVALGDWYFETGECEQGKAHYDVAKTLSTGDTANLVKDQQEKLAICEAPR